MTSFMLNIYNHNIATKVIYHEEMTWSFMLNIHVAATTKVMQSCLLVTHGRRHLPRLTFRQRPGW